jgi:5-methyltetrahydrofolate--homocysteine methyltransferase
MGKVVFATAAGDIHDIGKDIIVFMLDVNSFEVCSNNKCLN